MSETQQAIGSRQTPKRGQRREMVGIVTSDKMTRTVIVAVDRLVRHPKYNRVIRRRSTFMAHDELGVHVGDKVRIVETRPLSARKRWRVVGVVQTGARPTEVGELTSADVPVTA
jgi:small subunit ribosomal protein S17